MEHGTSKTCTKCGEAKPLTEYYKAKANRDGHCNDCKQCRKARSKSRYEAIRSDPESWQEELLRLTQWRSDNPDRAREIQQNYRDANRESERFRQRTWREQNPELQAEANRRWAANNRDKRAATERRYWAANIDKRRDKDARRHAIKVGATIGEVDYAAIRAQYVDCYLCGLPLDGPVDMDHVAPLSRGGSHSEANLKPTHASCNRRKNGKLLCELGWYDGPTDIGQ